MFILPSTCTASGQIQDHTHDRRFVHYLLQFVLACGRYNSHVHKENLTLATQHVA